MQSLLVVYSIEIKYKYYSREIVFWVLWSHLVKIFALENNPLYGTSLETAYIHNQAAYANSIYEQFNNAVKPDS